jgi:predicted phosphate transport protein (TIGR00153 family)
MPRIRYDYFATFEALAEYACKEAQMLVDIISDYDPSKLPEQLKQIHELEHGADDENHELFRHIASEFITPIEREDIVSMAKHLDDIVDFIEDVVQRFYMFNVTEMHPRALEMAKLLLKSTSALREALRDFRNFKNSKELKRLLIAVEDAEEEADYIYLEAIRDLYVNHTDNPVYILAWNNLFTRMEKCADECENTATAISTITLKNS